MSTILQDMMGMLKRNGTVTPQADNYITVARYPNPQERLKPAPKLQTELVTLAKLKTFLQMKTSPWASRSLICSTGSSGKIAPSEIKVFSRTVTFIITV